MSAKGTDKRGQGGATATITSTLRQEGAATLVEVNTDFSITGRLARFGRGGMIEDISKRMLRDFGNCLQESLAHESPEAAATPEAEAAGAVAAAAPAGAAGAAPPAPSPAHPAAASAAGAGEARPRPVAVLLRAVGAHQAALRARDEQPTPRAWDGAAYDRLSTPMQAMGLEVLDRLPLAGDETVIDAGCGSGRVTEALVERLPRGRAIGVDASPSMIEAARERLGDRADLHVADLLALDLGVEADAILSTATFHWIDDHDRLFARLRAHLRDGGRLEAQCGGEGNIANVHAAAEETIATARFAPHFASWQRPWLFATPGDTERRLRAAGFSEAQASLMERPVTPEDPHAYLDRDQPRRPSRTAAGAAARPVRRRGRAAAGGGGRTITIGYVRLNITARA